MAITRVHQTYLSSLEHSLSYAMADKDTCTFVPENLPSYLRYNKEENGAISFDTLTTTLFCANPTNPKEDFWRYINFFGENEILAGNSRSKDNQPLVAWRILQSFDRFTDPKIVNEIGRKLVQELLPYRPAVISTHTNTEHTHNYIVVCSWDCYGRKWDYCHEALQLVRETSDRLCEEYSLPVLEHTRLLHLSRWKDAAGKTHYWEPTERKARLRDHRKKHPEISWNVSEYRNTFSYKLYTKSQEDTVYSVQQSIRKCLPYVSSFENLLDRLTAEFGVSILAKKKDGQWRQHILYRPLESTKYIQDSSLSADGFYLRESLTEYIKGQNRERERGARLQKEHHLPVFNTYIYGAFDLLQLNEIYRAYMEIDGSVRVKQRSDFEKYFLRRIKDNESFLRRMEARGLCMDRPISPKDMQASLDALRFLETHKFNSLGEIQKESARLHETLKRKEPLLEQANYIYQDYESKLRSSRETGEPLPENYRLSHEEVYSSFLESLEYLINNVAETRRDAEKCDRALHTIQSVLDLQPQRSSLSQEKTRSRDWER